MPTPEEYAAERLAARAEKYRTQVARLRTLLDHRGAQETSEPEQGAEQ